MVKMDSPCDFSNCSDDEVMKKMESKNENDQKLDSSPNPAPTREEEDWGAESNPPNNDAFLQLLSCPTPNMEQEDWEAEIDQLNKPYGPEDYIVEKHSPKMPFYVPDHKPSDITYDPSVHHAPAVLFNGTEEVSVEEGQFDDADE